MYICIFIEFAMFHLVIHLIIWLSCLWKQEKRIRYNYVSMALIISSFGKMLLILMVIWDYKQLEYSWLVSIIVMASNIEALSGIYKYKYIYTHINHYLVYLNMPYIQTSIIIILGTLGRILGQFLFLYITYFSTSSKSVYYFTKAGWINL